MNCILEHHKNDLIVDKGSANTDAQIDLFLTAAPPRRRLLVDGAYLESLWSRVLLDADVSSIHREHDDQTTPPSALASGQLDFIACHAKQHLVVNERRAWHILAGHDIDHVKIPKMQFRCLRIVASRGLKGILQPDLVRETGQDKRSVPKRTDMLAANGYITKESCIGSGSKTSLLRLARFSRDQDRDDVVARVKSASSRLRSADSLATVILIDRWYAIIMDLLDNSVQGVVPWETICHAIVPYTFILLLRGLRLIHSQGVEDNSKHARVLNKALRRLVAQKAIEKVMLPGISDEQHFSSSSSRDRWIKCIRRLRLPTESDGATFADSLRGDSSVVKTSTSHNGEDPLDEFHDHDLDYSDDDYHVAGNLTRHNTKGLDVRGSADAAMWSPDVHYTNMLFEIVQRFGQTGGVATVSSPQVDDVSTSSLSCRMLRQPLGVLHGVDRSTRLLDA